MREVVVAARLTDSTPPPDSPRAISADRYSRRRGIGHYAVVGASPVDDGNRIETSKRDPRSSAMFRTRLPRGARVAATVAACWLGMLVLLIAIGYHVTLPDERTGMQPAGGGIGAAAHQLLGKAAETDFLIDYASAHALIHGDDAYAPSSALTKKVGIPWAVPTADPHPPTFLLLVLPFTVVRYQWAEAAWASAMVTALIVTIRLVGIRWWYAAGAGVAIAITFPGAWGISNPVPLIGLGAAIAYRFRDRPWIAGLGLALAAVPKWSGLLLVLPFLLTRRWRPVAASAAYFAATAIVPLAWQPSVWSRYLDSGVSAIRHNEVRGDNASLLHQASQIGIPSNVLLAGLVVAALVAVVSSRDCWWPSTWLVVAALPIAWLYSALTLLPLAAIACLRPARWPRFVVLLLAGVLFGSPPAGPWTLPVFPFAVVLGFLLLFSRPALEEARWWPPELHSVRAFRVTDKIRELTP